MKSNNVLKKERYSDFEKATTLVVEFITADDLIAQLEKNKNTEDLKTIAELIKNDVFHINLADGVSKKDVDIILMNNLASSDANTKSQAALSAIYNVRCNMQHGEKHFQEHQRILLDPLIKILESVVELQIKKLK